MNRRSVRGPPGAAGAGGTTVTWGGDLTGSSNTVQTVKSLTGSSGSLQIATTAAILNWATGTVTPQLSQTTQASNAVPNSMLISPQAANAAATGVNGVSGGWTLNVGVNRGTATTEAGIVLQRATTTLFRLVGYEGSNNGVPTLYSNLRTGSDYTLYVGPSQTSLSAAASGTIDISIGQVARINCTLAAVQIGNSGTIDRAGATQVLSLGPMSGNAVVTPTACGVLGVDSTNSVTGCPGLHAYLPSASLFDIVLAGTCQGTVNSQYSAVRKYIGVARTTTNTAVTILTIPIPTTTVASICVTISGRDVSAGTVGDGFAYQNLVMYKNVAGTLAAADTLDTAVASYNTSMATCAVTYVISGTNLLIKVNGLSSVVVDWTATAEALVT
jgi:hypothetical protein